MNKLFVIGVLVALCVSVSVDADLIDIRVPCVFHVSIKEESQGEELNLDCFGIAELDEEKVQHFTHLSISAEDGTGAIMSCTEGECNARGNLSGSCTSMMRDGTLEAADQFVAENFGFILSFDAEVFYDTVKCPNGDSGCKKFTNDESGNYIVLDSMSRLVKRSVSSDDVFTFTWFDDAPTMDMFSHPCTEEEWPEPDPHCLNIVHINYGCAFHGKMCTDVSEECYDFYGMMKDPYAFEYLNFPEASQYGLLRCDAERTFDKAVPYYDACLQRKGAMCTTGWALIPPSFEWDNTYTEADCGDGTRTCSEYCGKYVLDNADVCITLDANNRLVKVFDDTHMLTARFTWFDDVPDLSIFAGKDCEGEDLPDAVPICVPGNSSSSSSSSSSGSSSSSSSSSTTTSSSSSSSPRTHSGSSSFVHSETTSTSSMAKATVAIVLIAFLVALL